MAIARPICPPPHHRRLRSHISMSHPFPVSLFHRRFFWTYKRTFPKFSVPVRAYTGLVSLCRFSPKSAQFAKRPNTRPSRELQASPRTFFAYCHLQKPAAALNQNPRRKAWPERRSTRSNARKSQHRPCSRIVSATACAMGSDACPPAQPRRRAPFRRFDFSIFRRFHLPPQPMPATSVGTISERLVSPYVTFDWGRPASVFRGCRSKENRPVWKFRGLVAGARGRRTFIRSSLRLPRGSVQNPSGLGITPGGRIFAAFPPTQGRSDCAPEPLHPRGRGHEAI